MIEKNSHNQKEMTISEIRRENLLKLLREKFDGVIARLSEALDRTPQQTGRWTAPIDTNNYRPIGDRIARHIEKALGLEDGWLDVEHKGTEWDVASSKLEEHFNAICVRPIILWQDMAAHVRGEDVRTVGAFSMPAQVSESAFYTQLPNDNIKEFAEAKELIAVDVTPTSPGDYVIAIVEGGSPSAYRLDFGANRGERTFSTSRAETSTDDYEILGKIVFSIQGLPYLV